MKDTTIAFIGGGNMAGSLVGGLIADGYPAANIWVADPDELKLTALHKRFHVNTTTANHEALKKVQAVVLAVKPQQIKAVAQELAGWVCDSTALVISIAAGVRSADLSRWLGGKAAVVRAMPNTPALVQAGATALYANTLVSPTQRNLAETILRAVGLVIWLDDEADMDAVTALSGSGPAYFFLMMEVLENAAIKLGLAPETAHLLALQTAFGSAKMALESQDGSSTLRARVTSPGGTTERAIKILQDGQLQELFDAALRGAHARSEELATQLGKT